MRRVHNEALWWWMWEPQTGRSHSYGRNSSRTRGWWFGQDMIFGSKTKVERGAAQKWLKEHHPT